MIENNPGILSKKEEFQLINNWQKNKDKESLNKIILAYKRMPIAYARRYARYGIPKEDLVHEGVIGIMHAIDKFDLKKNLRLSTYASWWIRASMQDYVLKNWSIVKIASTAAQKSLFFGLNKIKNKISNVSNDFMYEMDNPQELDGPSRLAAPEADANVHDTLNDEESISEEEQKEIFEARAERLSRRRANL